MSPWPWQSDLEDIKERYYQLYSQTLYNAVSTKTQGDYSTLLLAVIDK